MSKVRYDKIQVGDLIEYEYQQVRKNNHLGYVTNVDHDKREITAFWSDDLRESPIYYTYDHEPIVGHWKVINFEEESKVDELKVYTGKETIEALLEGKTLEHYNLSYRFADELQVDFREGKGWEKSQIEINHFLGFKLTEVVLPQVGDWVKVIHNGQTDVGKITKVKNGNVWAHWNGEPNEDGHYLEDKTIKSWQILSSEQITEYKREQAFSKVGRKLNEFREGDIVMIDSLGVTAIVVSKKNDPKVQLHGINQVGKGHVAQPHQLTPIAFSESQVDLS